MKYKQMSINPNVALCLDNYQIEGKVKDIGHPLELKNATISNLYGQHHPLAYKRYARLETETLFEIHPSQITVWKKTEIQSYRDVLMIFAKKAYREPCITFIS